tara:strand:+ start:3756 stop:4733 length:978 start_codon:yes stop_codon:yes gene_type:complete
VSDKSVIEFYTSKEGDLRIDVQLKDDTVWLTQAQMVELFGRDKSVISRHIKNVFETGELDERAVVAKNATTAADGKTYQVEYYNLDVILSVGYRVNSKRGTQFRKWSSSVLKEHLIKGYTLNERRLQQQGEDFQALTSLLETSIKKHDLGSPEALEMISIVKQYASSFTLLQQYDKDALSEPAGKKSSQEMTIEVARELIATLKQNLIEKGEATPLFGNEKDNSFEALIGNIEQTFGGQYLYETVEKKAAHLLYFMVKDHPFTDGNKRSAAYLFLAYLAKNGLLNIKGHPSINESGLVAITLLIAESDPAQKDLMTKLVQNLICA